jgi:plastocyanin
MLLFAACGGASDASNPGSRPTEVPANAPFIDQDGLRFKPKELAAKTGQVVFFANSESAIHTVTINGKNESGTMKHGAVFQWTAGAAGSYQVTCDFHPQMKATITVSD